MQPEEFKLCVARAVELLNQRGITIGRGEAGATAFEADVCRALTEVAVAMGLRAKPVHVGGRRFPDIVFEGTRYGVEVKTSKQGWQCLGNSVLASTRLEGVDKIELVFGSGTAPASVRSADYKDCVASVEVTHSPRYVLDMNLGPTEGYFANANFSFEQILKASDPIALVVQEAKARLGDGEWLWWMGDRPEGSAPSPIVIRKWSVLPKKERSRLIGRAFAFFPETLKPSRADYDRIALWLVMENSVINSSLRDVFSAGGTRDIQTPMGLLEDAPRALYSLCAHLPEVMEAIKLCTPDEWSRWYGTAPSKCSTPSQRLFEWKNAIRTMIQEHASRSSCGADVYKVNCINSFLDSVSL